MSRAIRKLVRADPRGDRRGSRSFVRLVKPEPLGLGASLRGGRWAALVVTTFVLGCTRGDVLTTRTPEPTLDVTPGAAALAPGTSRVFAAQVTNSTAPLTWVASAGTVVSDGLRATYTAPMEAGSQTLTVTLESTPRKTVVVPITVSNQFAFGLAIPTAHPRLWWNDERLARARRWLASNPFTPNQADVTGLALHGLLANDAAECQRAITLVLALDFSMAPNDILEDEGEGAFLTYDWCHALWTPAQRAQFTSTWNQRLHQFESAAWGGPTMPQSDVYWARVRNHFEWGVTSFGENADAPGFLREALEVRWRDSFLPHALAGGSGGALQEGSHVGALVLGCATVPLVTARLLGRDLFAETPFFEEAAFTLAANTSPAPTLLRNTSSRFFEVFPSNEEPYFSNGRSAERTEYADFMAAIADVHRSRRVGGIARGWLAKTGATANRWVLATNEQTASSPLSEQPLDFFQAGPSWMIARSSWAANATVLQLQLGAVSGTGHEHSDLGAFQLWRDGAWLTRESAGGFGDVAGLRGVGRVPSSDPLAHDVVLIDGKGHAVLSAAPIAAPVLNRLESTNEYAFAAIDLTPAYRDLESIGGPRDNPLVRQYVREFVLLRAEQALVVLDRITTTTAGVARTFVMHFEQPPTLEGPQRVRSVTGDGQVLLTTLVPAAPLQRSVSEGGIGQHRVELETAGAADQVFLSVVQGTSAGFAERAVSLTEQADRWDVQVGASRVTLLKGATSQGGSVTVAGATRAFRTDVQRQRLTLDGPRWDP